MTKPSRLVRKKSGPGFKWQKQNGRQPFETRTKVMNFVMNFVALQRDSVVKSSQVSNSRNTRK